MAVVAFGRRDRGGKKQLRIVAILSILLLVAATGGMGGGSGAGVSPQLRLDITDAGASPEQPFEAFDTVQFTVFDFQGDGVKEIVAKNDNNWIYVFDSRTGAVLAEMRDAVPSKWAYRELSGVAIGDVNGNGAWDIVSASSAGMLTVWELDAFNSTGAHLAFTKLWSKRVDPELVDPEYRTKNPWLRNESTGFDGAPYLADVDGDGADEIFVQADNLAGHWAFRGDGKVLWGRVWDDGNANPWVADLDRDGKLEVIFATDAGRIWAYDAKTGDWRWQFEASQFGAKPGSISLAPGLIDINGDGRLEVIFGTRMAVENKSDPDWMSKMHTMIFAVSSKGQLLWNKSFDWGSPHVYMFPAAVDVDGDGVDEAVFVDWNTIGHKPGNWETTGRPNFFAINGRGEVLFHKKVSTYWSNKNVVVADFDGDGKQEILLNEGGDQDGLGIYDLQGKRKATIPLPWAASRAPLVTDLYGDGSMQLVVPMAKSRKGETNYRTVDVGYRAGRIQVYDLGVPYDAAWDNVFVFNHGLDHLYGGKATVDSRPNVDANITLLDDAPLRVRVVSDQAIREVRARVLPDGASVTLTHEGDAWRGTPSGEAFDVTVHFESGAFLSRSIGKVPIPTPTPTTQTPTGGTTTPAPSTPAESVRGRSTPMPGLVAAGVALGVALAVAGPRKKT